MSKITLSLWRDKRTSMKEVPVYVVIRHRSKRATVASGVTVEPKHWNERTGDVRKTHPHAGKLNRRLGEIVTEAQAAALDLVAAGREPWPLEVKARLEEFLHRSSAEEEEVPCLIAYGRALLAAYDARGQVSTYKVYRTALTKLRLFWCGPDAAQDERPELERPVRRPLPFLAITPPLLRQFQAYLIRQHKNRVNTVHKTMTSVRAILRQAQRDGLVGYEHRPFDGIRLSKEKVMKQKLTMDEVRAIHGLDLEAGSLLCLVRDMWAFAFFAGGMRFADVALMRREHIQTQGAGEEEEVRSFYKMGKTGNVHGVLLVPQALALLDRYGWRGKRPADRVFPLLDGYDLSTPKARRSAIEKRNALANKYLKKIQARAGITTNLTFHLSRHSLAGYLLESGADLYTIQKVLGHETASQTQEYLRGFKGQGPDAAMRSVHL
jgi:integrase